MLDYMTPTTLEYMYHDLYHCRAEVIDRSKAPRFYRQSEQAEYQKLAAEIQQITRLMKDIEQAYRNLTGRDVLAAAIA